MARQVAATPVALKAANQRVQADFHDE